MAKNKKGRSVQQLLGIQSFTDYGLKTDAGELIFFYVQPTNISVLSAANIEIKILQLMNLLSNVPDLEVVCLDSCECFDGNKAYLQKRAQEENNPHIHDLLLKDRHMLSEMQVEMATARQFIFIKRCKGLKPDQVFTEMNDAFKKIVGEGFEAQRMNKQDIKRLVAIYFGASMDGDRMPDVDGAQYFKEVPRGNQ